MAASASPVPLLSASFRNPVSFAAAVSVGGSGGTGGASGNVSVTSNGGDLHDEGGLFEGHPCPRAWAAAAAVAASAGLLPLPGPAVSLAVSVGGGGGGGNTAGTVDVQSSSIVTQGITPRVSSPKTWAVEVAAVPLRQWIFQQAPKISSACQTSVCPWRQRRHRREQPERPLHRRGGPC